MKSVASIVAAERPVAFTVMLTVGPAVKAISTTPEDTSLICRLARLVIWSVAPFSTPLRLPSPLPPSSVSFPASIQSQVLAAQAAQMASSSPKPFSGSA